MPVASRSVFSMPGSVRVVNADSLTPFRCMDYFSRQDIEYSPALSLIVSLDAKRYIAEYGGMPGLVKGASADNGMLVFSPNMKKYTQVCASRVAGNKIKFGYGSEQVSYDRDECWEFAVKRDFINIITETHRANGEDYPLVLTRDYTACPICLDDLSGNVVCCDMKHQTCLKCYNLLPDTNGLRIKKCVLCNKETYSMDEIDKVMRMNGIITERPAYFEMEMYSCNKMTRFYYQEAHFLFMMKYMLKASCFDIFRTMLLSSLYNFYMTHPDSFGGFDFGFTNYKDDDVRSYSPMEDDTPEVVLRYLDVIDTPAIIDDIKYTQIHMGGYDDRQFYREMTEIDGNIERIKDFPNADRLILEREIYFRYKVKNTPKSELIIYFQSIFRVITQRSSAFGNIFKNIKRET